MIIKLPLVKILPHSVDLERFKVNDPSQSKHDLIYVGRLVPSKRVDLILAAIAELRKRYPQICMCIVGDGPERVRLERMACDHTLESCVSFVSYSNNVEEYLQKSRILVMASDLEGLPFSIIEAMASGGVPVSTNVGTIEDIIKDRVNGFLVGKGDLNMLIERLGTLLESRQLYEKFRPKITNQRENLGYSHATEVWGRWLTSLS